ncbi:efflux RND transporter periplasmic adaptor subunit [Aurantivibrio plasticivorans]
MNKMVLVAAAGVVIVAGGILIKEASAPDPGDRAAMMRGGFSVAVESTVVERVSWTVTAEAVGTAYANESVEITSNVSDTVKSVHFEDGQRVEAGSVLVVLNHNEEDAELQVSKANLAEQTREVKRLSGLVQSKSVSQSLLDERLTAQETAKYRLAAVEARLKDRYIKAPFSGVLGLREVSIGSYVSPGRVITTLDDIETIKLDFSIPAIYLGYLKPNLDVSAVSPAFPDKVFAGKIATIDSRINEIDRSLKLRAVIPNPDMLLRPGMLLHIEMVLDVRDTIVVPESSIVQEQDKHYVYVIEGEEKKVAKRQVVEIGVRKPGQVEILSGLTEGQHIISRGTNTVREGRPVRIVNQEPEQPAS